MRYTSPIGPFAGRVWNVSAADRQRIRQAARETLARVRPNPSVHTLSSPAAGAPNWYRIDNSAVAANGERSAEIFIYDEIGASWWGGGVSADDFVRELATLNVDRIDLRLNTPGGDAFDGIAIYNALRVHRAQVHVYVDALAASAGSIIAMAGDTVTMRRASRMMIHDASGLAVGNAADMRSFADLLDALSDDIAATYVARAGGSVADWRTRMLAETWFSAEEAVKAKLADDHDDSPAPEVDESVVPGGAAAGNPLDFWAGIGAAPVDAGQFIADDLAVAGINIDASAMLAALRGESRG